jgi:hypothetical protein
MPGPLPQTSGRFRLINGVYLLDAMTDEEARAATTERLKKEKAREDWEKQRREEAWREHDRNRARNIDSAVERGKENLAAAKERLDLANAAWERAKNDLNATLSSARGWLGAGKLANFVSENLVTGGVLSWLGRAVRGASWASRFAMSPNRAYYLSTPLGRNAARGVRVLEGLDGAKDVQELVDLAREKGFLPIGDYMSPDGIAEYGKGIDALADGNSLEGGQVVAEGRDKLRSQFAAARKARQEQLDAEDNYTTAQAKLGVAEWDQSRAGTHVPR